MLIYKARKLCKIIAMSQLQPFDKKYTTVQPSPSKDPSCISRPIEVVDGVYYSRSPWANLKALLGTWAVGVTDTLVYRYGPDMIGDHIVSATGSGCVGVLAGSLATNMMADHCERPTTGKVRAVATAAGLACAAAANLALETRTGLKLLHLDGLLTPDNIDTVWGVTSGTLGGAVVPQEKGRAYEVFDDPANLAGIPGHLYTVEE
jgi:hypothetical protein